jgi:SPP1 family phage portal protein
VLSIAEIRRFIQEDQTSTKKQHAKKGLSYYEARHDIKDYKIYYFDDEGILQEDNTRSNERISHPFLTELVDQCTQYMLSGKDSYVKSDIPELQTFLDEYFDDEFKMELNDLLTYASVEGFSYLYRYANEEGKSRFKFADGLNVVEVPAKYASDNKDYVIYYYYWKEVKNKVIHKVEVWDNENVYYFNMINSSTIKKDEEQEQRPHILYEEDSERYYDTFNSIPFIRFDNNRRQFSDLHAIKDLIDDYDLMSCGLSNNIQDLSEGFYVVKGFNGHNMDELTYAIKNKKQVGVGENGDVDIKTIQIPYEARKTKLDLDEKNIYRFGMGFDSSKAEASNVTNVVIKSRYALLDLKSNKKEMQLKRLMKKIIGYVIDEINKENDTSYKVSDCWCEFERVVPSNETDNATIRQTEANTKQIEINTLLNVVSHIDDETLLKKICEVLDIDYEEVADKVIDAEAVSLEDAQATLDGTEPTQTEQTSTYKITSIIDKYHNGSLTRAAATRLLKGLNVSDEDIEEYLVDE